ncbi:MAG: aminoacyl-tRNA hydrolase [Spirochaeta sp.]
MITAVIGLGNPGPQYRNTRHNIGRLICAALVDRVAGPTASWKSRFHGSWTHLQQPPVQLRVLIPDTYMNKAGESIRPFCDFFSLQPEQLLLVHDDLELPFGTVAHRRGGGLGGHNGLRSAEKHLGSRDFARLRIGIGRPARGDVSSWVLGRFSEQEEAELEDIIEEAVQTILSLQ